LNQKLIQGCQAIGIKLKLIGGPQYGFMFKKAQNLVQVNIIVCHICLIHAGNKFTLKIKKYKNGHFPN